ncbi:MAG: nicotinate phosphoribosyltransferase, partial [Rhodothermales bacterium]
RRILDDGGLRHVRIFASNSLDEHAIADLVRRGAPIDGFGVGTRMGALADQPYLDSVYKLVEYAGHGRMKLATHKSTLPGRKQIFRIYESGTAVHDVLALHYESHEGKPLLHPVMKGGRRTEAGRFRPLDELRAHARTSLARLPDHLLALDTTETPYPVVLSDRLRTARDQTRRSLEERSRQFEEE